MDPRGRAAPLEAQHAKVARTKEESLFEESKSTTNLAVNNDVIIWDTINNKEYQNKPNEEESPSDEACTRRKLVYSERNRS